MKIELVKIENKIAGYNLIPKNEIEQLALNAVREIYFWGINEDIMRYNGIETDVAEKMVTKMKFLQKKYQDNSMDKITPFYKCPDCGSKDMKIKAWVKPNCNNEFAGFCSDEIYENEFYCNDCDENKELVLIEPMP